MPMPSYFQERVSRIRRSRTAVGLVALLTLSGFALLSVSKTHAAEDPAISANTRNAAGPLTTPLAVDWKFSSNLFPNNPASPLIDGDNLYFSTGTRLYGLDRHTGAKKWQYPDAAPLLSPVQGAPVFSDGILYFAAGENLYALNAADGKPHWDKPFHIGPGISAAPVVSGDTIYFGVTAVDDSKFYAVSTKTGESLSGIWKNGIPIGGDLDTDFTIANNGIYYVTNDEILHSLDLSSGVQRWSAHLNADALTAKPIISGETMYLATGAQLSTWRVASGQPRWAIPLPAEAAVPPVVDADGTAYVITSDRDVYAVDIRGRGVWKQAAKLDFIPVAPPTLVDGLLIIGTAQGGIYALDAATGAIKWNYQLQPSSTDPNLVPTTTKVCSRPAVANGTLYVLSDDGTLTAFRHDAVDTTPPTVSHLEPAPGDEVNGSPPFYIGAQIMDEGSGINTNTLSVKLDDAMIPRRPAGAENTDKIGFSYDQETNFIEYATEEGGVGKSATLSDGHHTVTVEVRDWMGNKVTKTWAFLVDSTLPKRARKGAFNPAAQSGYPGTYPGANPGQPSVNPFPQNPGGQGGRGRRRLPQ